jgi:hypothetical protein
MLDGQGTSSAVAAPDILPVEMFMIARIVGVIFCLVSLARPDVAFGQTVKIVGVGSASCKDYLREIGDTPAMERDYLAWAQGYMSGILVRAPTGVDETLDLTPSTFPLPEQMKFLRVFCQNNDAMDFADGVQELYRTLRRPSG